MYENYNKFIAATDIIRAMKSNVDGMDATMVDLKQKIGGCSCSARGLGHHVTDLGCLRVQAAILSMQAA